LRHCLKHNFENKDTLTNAFRTCGLCPFNPNAINCRKPLKEKSLDQTIGQIKNQETARGDKSYMKMHLKFIQERINKDTLKQFNRSRAAQTIE
jgi:hypothetical protein